MYNRYVPQPDGSYRRSRMEERLSPCPPPSPQPRQEEERQACNQEQEYPHTCRQESQARPIPPVNPSRQPRRPRRESCQENHPGQSIGSFFRQLLPRGLDTEDLIIVLLLLLMAGNDSDGQNNALLTLALYLFL